MPTKPEYLPDLDTMNVQQLERFIEKYSMASAPGKLFPDRLPGYKEACRGLVSMATWRIKHLNGGKPVYNQQYNCRYRRLPKWAQWRRRFNPELCALPGKKFRKHPPKSRKKPLDLPIRRG